MISFFNVKKPYAYRLYIGGMTDDVLRARNATIWDNNACAKSYGYNATADQFEDILCVKGIEYNATVCSVRIIASRHCQRRH